VALYAVDSLRQLVAKLLARAELEHFTHQEEALRPFVAVLRQCDEACVRELAVQCVMQVCGCRVLVHSQGFYVRLWVVVVAGRLWLCLRQRGEACVRALAVQCVMQVCGARVLSCC
jgi:hypothetical protein